MNEVYVQGKVKKSIRDKLAKIVKEFNKENFEKMTRESLVGKWITEKVESHEERR